MSQKEFYGRVESSLSRTKSNDSQISMLTDTEKDPLRTDSPHRVLRTKTSGVLGRSSSTTTAKRMVHAAKIQDIIFPWMKAYRAWWFITIFATLITMYTEPYQIAFQSEPGIITDAAAFVEGTLTIIFTIDIVVNFNLAFYRDEEIIYERTAITKNYCSLMFWVDLVGAFPFETIALAITRQFQRDTNEAFYISLIRLLRFVRLHRMGPFSDYLQYDSRVSLLWFTLARNFAVALWVTHFSACTMYFLAKLENFSDNTWLGSTLVDEETIFQRYIMSLYWSVVTFATVGYGDFSCLNSIERIWGMFFMFLNIVVQSWIIGSITLLIVKSDEKTGDYRDSLEVLDQYATMHNFDHALLTRLETQLRLQFNNREIADEKVLQNFPSALRRKILRKLYLPSLLQTSLMEGIRQQFVDAFLAACNVEIFSPGEEIVERGSISSDLFLLVGGIAEVTTSERSIASLHKENPKNRSKDLFESNHSVGGRQLKEGEFIGEIGFFTESPQIDTVCCLTVCKTLTMSRSSYKLIAQDHPGSVGKILQNLLQKVEDASNLMADLPQSLPVLRAGSHFDVPRWEPSYGSCDQQQLEVVVQGQKDLTAIQDLVKMHMSKQKDDHTTRFLFAASRGDINTISLMCDQGFDPDSADYDNRTALMVSSMKGNIDVVKKILEYKADPNKVDVHGSSALYEAVKNGHEGTMELLLDFGAKLCMSESLAASILCQAVYDGDVLFLKRLLRARISVNASDYDGRTAAHLAAAEGNVTALKVLVDYGADLTMQDRWDNTPTHEAQRSNMRPMMQYMDNAHTQHFGTGDKIH